MAKKILNKTFKAKLKKYLLSFANARQEPYVDNPDFELCKKRPKSEYEDPSTWKCNTCEYKDSCGKGEKIFIENENLIEEVIDETIKLIERREQKFCSTKSEGGETSASPTSNEGI
ncbi:MAG: hypothetical protein ACFFG0_02815 [Candidatus Thorarchaeota archaeon]